MAQPTPRVALGDIIRRVCYSAHKDLEEVSIRLANVDDATRKTTLQAFFQHLRHRFIKLLALVRWCVESGRLVSDLLALTQDYNSNEVRIFEAVGFLRRSATVLNISRAPAYDVSNAVDVLSTGSYLKLPRGIAMVRGNQALDDRLPEMDETETLRKLEQYILERLLRTKVPPQFTGIRISDGTLTCTVDHEFEVTLTLSGAALDSPWVVLRLEILVAGESTHGTKADRMSKPRPRKRRGVVASLDTSALPGDKSDEESSDENEAESGGEQPSDRVPPKPVSASTGGAVVSAPSAQPDSASTSATVRRKRMRATRARDASAALRPKRRAVLYLLKILQQRLLSSSDPLGDSYEILHGFCAALCVRTLEAQAHELTENHWKEGALQVTSPATNVVELRHWAGACSLRICYDPQQRDGQTFVELKPALDTSSCRSSIAMALAKTPPTRRHRSVEMTAAEHDTTRALAQERSAALFVDGLCPSRLNVEKVLLLGAMAHAEGRLNQLGLALDHLMLEAETAGVVRKSAGGAAGRPLQRPAWAPNFRHTISVVTDRNHVALHVDLPVQRYLRITVEMRTGEYIVSLVRKTVASSGFAGAAASGSGDGTASANQTTRAWGSTSDLEVLSLAERAMNRAFVASKAQGAAEELYKLIGLASMQSIIESLELAAEDQQLAFQRASPFIPLPRPEDDKLVDPRAMRKQSATPSLFIRLLAWDGVEYFLGVCGQSLSSTLFPGVARFGEPARAGAGGGDASLPSVQLDWFVVGGPFNREVCTNRAVIMLGHSFGEHVPENFSSDLTVRDMLDQGLQHARKLCVSMRVACFRSHFSSSAELLPRTQTIQVAVTRKASGLIAAAFGEPHLRATFRPEQVGVDISLERSVPAPFAHRLPVGTPPLELAIMFALSGPLTYAQLPADADWATACSGLCLEYRPDSEESPFGPATPAASTPTPGANGNGIVRNATDPRNGELGANGPVRSKRAAPLADVSNLIGMNLDLISASKMEIFCQCLLEARGGSGSPDTVVLHEANGSPCAFVKILYASHSCAMLECHNDGVLLRAAIGISSCEDRLFEMRILSIRAGGEARLPLPEELPWAHEVVKLINTYIPSTLSVLDWNLMRGVVRQVLASLTYGLPALPALHDVLNPQPTCILNANKTGDGPARGGMTPTPGGGRGGGKFGLSMSIQMQKAASDKGSRGVSVLALSHLRLRFLVGEARELDLRLLPDGVVVDLPDNSRIAHIVAPHTKVAHDAIHSVLRRAIGALLDDTDKEHNVGVGTPGPGATPGPGM